jgi:hypothetical protein
LPKAFEFIWWGEAPDEPRFSKVILVREDAHPTGLGFGQHALKLRPRFSSSTTPALLSPRVWHILAGWFE